jgi:hypothetical protein
MIAGDQGVFGHYYNPIFGEFDLWQVPQVVGEIARTDGEADGAMGGEFRSIGENEV